MIPTIILGAAAIALGATGAWTLNRCDMAWFKLSRFARELVKDLPASLQSTHQVNVSIFWGFLNMIGN